MARRRRPRSSARSARVGAKVKKLIAEGKPPKQAQAIAESLERSGRLGPRGGLKKR